VKNTIFSTLATRVTAAKKTASVAPAMVCKVLSIGLMIVRQSFANPKLVFGEPARIIINSGNSNRATGKGNHGIKMGTDDGICWKYTE
jgi:hypothetical protein